jgi:hypothetical protein
MADVTAVSIISRSRSLRDLRRRQKKKPRMMQIMREPPAVPAPMPAWAPVLRPFLVGAWSGGLFEAPLLLLLLLLPLLPLLPLLLVLPGVEIAPLLGVGLTTSFSVVVTPLSRTVVTMLFIVTERTSGVSVIVDMIVVVRFALETVVIVRQNVV